MLYQLTHVSWFNRYLKSVIFQYFCRILSKFYHLSENIKKNMKAANQCWKNKLSGKNVSLSDFASTVFIANFWFEV